MNENSWQHWRENAVIFKTKNLEEFPWMKIHGNIEGSEQSSCLSGLHIRFHEWKFMATLKVDIFPSLYACLITVSMNEDSWQHWMFTKSDQLEAQWSESFNFGQIFRLPMRHFPSTSFSSQSCSSIFSPPFFSCLPGIYPWSHLPHAVFFQTHPVEDNQWRREYWRTGLRRKGGWRKMSHWKTEYLSKIKGLRSRDIWLHLREHPFHSGHWHK